MSALLKKSAAIWLAFLVLSPFTAPFSTCDLAGLARAGRANLRGAPAVAATRAAVADSSWSQIARVPRTPYRSKPIALIDGGSPQRANDRSSAPPIRRGQLALGAAAAAYTAVLRI